MSRTAATESTCGSSRRARPPATGRARCSRRRRPRARRRCPGTSQSPVSRASAPSRSVSCPGRRPRARAPCTSLSSSSGGSAIRCSSGATTSWSPSNVERSARTRARTRASVAAGSSGSPRSAARRRRVTGVAHRIFAEKVEHELGEELWLFQVDHVRDAGELDDLGSRHRGGQMAFGDHGARLVGGADQDERRHARLSQPSRRQRRAGFPSAGPVRVTGEDPILDAAPDLGVDAVCGWPQPSTQTCVSSSARASQSLASQSGSISSHGGGSTPSGSSGS